MISKVSLVLAAGLALAGASAPASAAMLVDGLNPVGPPPSVELAQFGLGGFLFGGRQYCWYDAGWRGPGWYWCGYAYRTGYGWGGGEGWQGHRHGGGGRGGFGGGRHFGGGHGGGMHMGGHGGGMHMGGHGGGMHMGGGHGGGGHGGGGHKP